MSKILFLDIETSPNILYSWCVGRKVNLTPDNIIHERQIICICWKWQGEKTIHSLDWGLKKQCDKALLKTFTRVINEADLIVAQNGDRYDLRFIMGRLAYHDLPPFHWAPTRDTLKQSRRAFFLNSHKLDYMGQFFSLGRKLETTFGLWKDVMAKDAKALTKMIRYCKGDVTLLEKAYDHIQRYTPQGVHMGILEHTDKMACKACGSKNTLPRGHRIKSGGIFECRLCSDCGHFWRTDKKVK